MTTSGGSICVQRLLKTVATTPGVSISVQSCCFTSSSSSYFSRDAKSMIVGKLVGSRQSIICFVEPSTSTVAAGSKEETPAAEKAAAKPKPAKAAAKPLSEMMNSDIIPALKTILQAQDDISKIELSFAENSLEGSFKKKNIPYVFWAFFPDGNLTGPKGFSLSSYGSEASTVEPFLVDEKKITDKHVVFWVEKRLAAQGIIPVWKDRTPV